jgi:hypothetical protein
VGHLYINLISLEAIYLDQFNPSVHGIVNVGSAIEQGKTFNMYIGGISSLPFNPSQAHRMVLSFVPKTVKFPPCNFFDIQCHNSKFNRQAAL